MEIIQYELQQKNYQIENLPNHITRFVKVQYKSTTRDTYNIGLTKFYNYLTANDITELNQENINPVIKEYKSYLENTTELASTSIDSYIEIVKVFSINHLDLQVKRIRKNNTGKAKKIKYIEFDEVKGMVNTVEYTTGNPEQITRNKAIICTLFGAGLRISELLNIKLEHYNPDKSTILIRGKGRATDELETIYLPKPTNQLINEYLHQRRLHNRSCKYLFCSLKDNQLKRQSVNQIIKKISTEYDTRNNKNITPRVSTHSFRHSLARYLLINKGYTIHQVKDILRHSSIETTAKYLENTNEEIQQLRRSIF